MHLKKWLRKSGMLVIGPMRSTFFKKEEKMGLTIGYEPGTSWTYFSNWNFPGMFVAQTHSFEMQKY